MGTPSFLAIPNLIVDMDDEERSADILNSRMDL
jgi:hypothetical protein